MSAMYRPCDHQRCDKFKEYGEAAGPVVQSYGGKVISRGPSELLSGQHDYKVTVILEFPSADKAREWYTSQEYQKTGPQQKRRDRQRFYLARRLVVDTGVRPTIARVADYFCG